MLATIRQIHDSGHCGVLAITGGGSGALSDLLTVPGASRSILEALVPYSRPSLGAFLGAVPAQACSQHTARSMAMAAFWRAIRWSHANSPVENDEPSVTQHLSWAMALWGVAGTASLATDRPKRGEHRFHVACQTHDTTQAWSVTLQKDRRTRAEEERLVADFLLVAVAEGCRVPRPELPKLQQNEIVQHICQTAQPEWRAVVLGESAAVRCTGSTVNCLPDRSERLLFPGAFHPLHEGHRRMAQWAATHLGKPVEFEISVRNVDKPPLDYVEIRERLEQFTRDQPVWLTNAPTFVEKARLFPGATFIVGADTLVRIADPKYYGNREAYQAALEELVEKDCRFLVFGRHVGDQFQTLDDLLLPAPLRRRCEGVPASEFRCDISSTEIRARQHIMEE
ncbi:MAG: hypothetical protein KatS3mg110_1535 [Pirellulaceae bacterium]|nr:MAG: hypothetical protein KatS3mg110_1535 [Pirellulaceae bacterium]